ncbi:MAG: hypothetical protein ACREOU_04850 [Candidatus Eiseniibacteriota bacterium]
MKKAAFEELVLQALETEMGGVQVYENAVSCAVNADLKREWQKYLTQTREHVRIVEGLCDELGIDPDTESPGRSVIKHLGESLVEAMRMAKATGGPEAAQLVALECVVIAETKDHMNWELLTEAGNHMKGKGAQEVLAACKQVEEEEDEHLYHTAGWTRELWIQFLGLPAVLPPPEETKDVKSAIGAERARQAREEML